MRLCATVAWIAATCMRTNAMKCLSKRALMGAALLCLSACGRARDRTPEGTLSLLRDALATGNPPIERVADTRIIAEATAVHGALMVGDRTGVPITWEGYQISARNAGVERDPRAYFAGVLPLLHDGHCVRIGDGRIPDVLVHVPTTGDRWPARLIALQQSVARRAANVFAGDYRCDDGLSFGAVFVHPNPNDGTLRVVAMIMARRRIGDGADLTPGCQSFAEPLSLTRPGRGGEVRAVVTQSAESDRALINAQPRRRRAQTARAARPTLRQRPEAASGRVHESESPACTGADPRAAPRA